MANSTSSSRIGNVANIPMRGLKGLRQNWKFDLMAGFTVSLIALPLCLGIAKASEFPAIAGLFTAIVGGLFASRLAGSNVTISGPAAGLIVINVAAVATLGGLERVKVACTGGEGCVDGFKELYAEGYPYALAAIVVGGLLVVLFGLLKVGKLGDFFPSAAVHGMLAAIGIIIIIKQLFDGMGVKAPKGKELFELVELIPDAVSHAVPAVLAITGISLLILVAFPYVKNKFIRMIPAPMWVLLATVPVAAFAFHLGGVNEILEVGADKMVRGGLLVHLPSNPADGITFPNFGKIGTGAFWVAVASIALVSGIESLLSAKAVDALDPWKRKSNLNRDLLAMGGGSAIAAFFGGLPMISEIVRSSANINNGGRTQWANFFHGGFLLIFMLLLAPVINLIPSAALAGMLIFTGFRLASPKEFKHMFQIAWTQLLVFLITIVVVLAVDLLVGIAAGIVAELIVNFASGAKIGSVFVAKTETTVHEGTATIKVHGSVTFTNYLSLRAKFNKLQHCSRIILDLGETSYVDHTVMANLNNLQSDLRAQGIEMRMDGLDNLAPMSAHPLAPRRKVAIAGAGLLPANLSRRQLEVMVYALNKKLDYSPESWDDLDGWDGFGSTTGNNVAKESCVIHKKGRGYMLTVADITVTTGALLTFESNTGTCLRLDFNQLQLPVFQLSHESALDKVAERLGAQDIDFDGHPDFSDTFLLQGDDEEAIRAYFKAELLEFHEQYRDFSVESNGHSILAYTNRKLASLDEINSMIAFGMAYCKLVLPVEADRAPATSTVSVEANVQL